MTPTSPSTAAGPEPRPAAVDPAAHRALLASWLRRAAAHPRAAELVLRGSLLLGAWCPERARPAADVDYVFLGRFDAADLGALAEAIAGAPDPGGPELRVEATERIWAETPFPGLRAHVAGRIAGAEAGGFHVDLAVGDPLSLPPRPTVLADVGPVLGVAPETLFAWKLHGLVEFGRGRWRAKDLFDLDLLWDAVPMNRAALRPAVELAFASRDLGLAALDDFRTRDGWGASRSGARKWRTLPRACQPGAPPGAFLETRARVRAAVEAILGG